MMLQDEPDIYVGSPVGFPGGAHRPEVKRLEAALLLEDGVQEMDIVMNIGRFKNKEYEFVLDELTSIVHMAQGRALTKVIIELNTLNDYEADKACEIVIRSGADFLKTGTGWIPGKANIERIRRIKQLTQGSIKVKASGGIRTRAEFDALLGMGVERFGINSISALEIICSFESDGPRFDKPGTTILCG